MGRTTVSVRGAAASAALFVAAVLLSGCTRDSAYVEVRERALASAADVLERRISLAADLLQDASADVPLQSEQLSATFGRDMTGGEGSSLSGFQVLNGVYEVTTSGSQVSFRIVIESGASVTELTQQIRHRVYGCADVIGQFGLVELALRDIECPDTGIPEWDRRFEEISLVHLAESRNVDVTLDEE